MRCEACQSVIIFYPPKPQYPNSESISLSLATWNWIRCKDYIGFIYSDNDNLVSPKVFC